MIVREREQFNRGQTSKSVIILNTFYVILQDDIFKLKYSLFYFPDLLSHKLSKSKNLNPNYFLIFRLLQGDSHHF